MDDLQQRIQPLCQRVELRLAQHFDQQSPSTPPQQLREAMRYGLLNGGKRLRPVLVYASCLALGGELHQADAAAAALECIHAYSLIHDDLPAMDDDTLRRGKPTCHIAFDEATAILAGDALQPLAFELLSQPCDLSPAIQLQMIQILAQASGDGGMVAGQALDIQAEGQRQTLTQLEQMHRLKTGALIRAAVQLGALASGHCDPSRLATLSDYAAAIGLAFQVQDDILDIESDTQTLGKTQGADLHRNKSTYPALLGLEGAKHKAAELHRQALEALQQLPSTQASVQAASVQALPAQTASLPTSTELLVQIADYIIARNH